MVNRAAIFALQRYNCLPFIANGVLTDGLTRQRRSHSPMPPLSATPRLRALFLWPEVRIDLHPDEKRSWILQID
mgnify:CR=1 FL=1